MKANHPLFFLLLVFLLPLAGGATLPVKDFEKRYTETFDINANGTVKLDNRYGEINVVTWDQQRVKIDVLVKVQARNEDDFQDVLERIDISLRGGGSTVSATTTIGNNSGSGWWKMITGGGSSDEYKIYYTVSMPAGVGLETKARYCDVSLPNLSGSTLLNVGYGDLVAGRLTGRSDLDISYGSARVEELGDESTIKLRYSEGTVRRAGNLRYDGRYSEIRLGKVGDLTLDVGYDEIDVESARTVRLNGNYNEVSIEAAESVYLDGNYTDFDLGTIAKIIEVEGNYGDVDIDELLVGFERVDIRVSYSDVEIDVADDAGYTLDLSARYGDIDVPRDQLSPRNISSESNTDKVTGTKAGKGRGTISIVTNYGDIEVY